MLRIVQEESVADELLQPFEIEVCYFIGAQDGRRNNGNVTVRVQQLRMIDKICGAVS